MRAFAAGASRAVTAAARLPRPESGKAGCGRRRKDDRSIFPPGPAATFGAGQTGGLATGDRNSLNTPPRRSRSARRREKRTDRALPPCRGAARPCPVRRVERESCDRIAFPATGRGECHQAKAAAAARIRSRGRCPLGRGEVEAHHGIPRHGRAAPHCRKRQRGRRDQDGHRPRQREAPARDWRGRQDGRFRRLRAGGVFRESDPRLADIAQAPLRIANETPAQECSEGGGGRRSEAIASPARESARRRARRKPSLPRRPACR